MEKAPDKCYVGNENVFCTKNCRKKDFCTRKVIIIIILNNSELGELEC